MKNRKQLLAAVALWITGFAIGLLFGGLAYLSQDVEWLKILFSVIAFVALMIPIPMSVGALVYSLWQFFKMHKGDNVEERKTKIHYTLPLAFPIAFTGLSFLSFVFAFFLAYILLKWAKPHYDWNEMKSVLLHRDGTSWGRTLLTWVNALFFIFASLYPILILAIFVGILYLLGKMGVIDGLFNMVTNTMASAGSSSSVSCSDCSHYGVLGDGGCAHGYSNANGRCPYHS